MFFIAVGASINFEFIGKETLTIVGSTLGVLIKKAVILTSVGMFSKLNPKLRNRSGYVFTKFLFHELTLIQKFIQIKASNYSFEKPDSYKNR